MSDDKGLLSKEEIIKALDRVRHLGTRYSHLEIESARIGAKAQLSALSSQTDEKLLTPKEILGLAAVSRFYVSHSEQWDFVSCVQSILKAQLAKVAPIMAALKARIQELESK